MILLILLLITGETLDIWFHSLDLHLFIFLIIQDISRPAQGTLALSPKGYSIMDNPELSYCTSKPSFDLSQTVEISSIEMKFPVGKSSLSELTKDALANTNGCTQLFPSSEKSAPVLVARNI